MNIKDKLNPDVIDIKDDEFNLYAISDLHLDHNNSLHDAFKYTIDVIAKDDKAKVLLLGDMLDFSVKVSVRDQDDRYMMIHSALERLAEYLEPIKHKIVGMVSGNHEQKTAKRWLAWVPEITLCNILKIDPYKVVKTEQDLSSIGLSIFRLTKSKHAKGQPHTRLVKVYYTHGLGSSSIGNVLNRMNKATLVEGVDIKIVGHFHKFGQSVEGVLYVDRYGNLRVRQAFNIALSSYIPTSNFLLTKGKDISIPVLAKVNIKLDGASNLVISPQIETLERFIPINN
jgi:predicted phosphodiesterase